MLLPIRELSNPNTSAALPLPVMTRFLLKYDEAAVLYQPLKNAQCVIFIIRVAGLFPAQAAMTAKYVRTTHQFILKPMLTGVPVGRCSQVS